MSPKDQVPLRIIGLGISIPDHITLQASKAIAACSRIYTTVQVPTSLWLPAETRSPVPVTNILDTYIEGALRSENYNRAAAIIFDSLREVPVVGYVTYGNPLAYDSVAQKLITSAQQARIGFQVVPGISSVDTLLCDIGADMAPGIQIYDATWLVVAEIQLEARVAAILLQVGAFGSFRAHYHTRPEARSLTALAGYLGRTYPSEHDVFVIRSSGAALDSVTVRRVRLKNLSSVPSEDLLNCSLYIPPLASTQFNERFLAVIEK